MTDRNDMGAQQADGLSQAEPVSRLGPSGFDPSRVTGERNGIRLTYWDGDITDPLERADLYKDLRRYIRGALTRELCNYHKRQKAEGMADSISMEVTDAAIECLWMGYVYD